MTTEVPYNSQISAMSEKREINKGQYEIRTLAV